MEIEKTIAELLGKINDLKKLASETGMDLSNEIKKLEKKVAQLSDNLYKNLSPWQRVQLARNPERPTTLDYIEYMIDDFIELHGDRQFGDDKAIVGGVGFFNGQAVTVIGHQKGRNTKENIERNFGMGQPEGYRKALRLMQQANKFNRPIITFINTAGAYPGKEGEERGQSEAIARNLREMAGLTVPVICVVIGEGGSGGALGIGVGNRIYMLENSYYSVISPEGAASILWKDATKAQEAAETMKITANDLKELGVIDGVIDEPKGGAHKDKEIVFKNVKVTIEKALNQLNALNKEQLFEDRYDKFKKIGEFGFLAE